MFANAQIMSKLFISGYEILHSIFKLGIERNFFLFSLSVFFNFLGRFFHFVSFVVSIQAIVIAFQISRSQGVEYSYKALMDRLGIELYMLAIFLPLAVTFAFAVPTISKRTELLILEALNKSLAQPGHFREITLSEDLYISSRFSLHLYNLVNFLSSSIFLIFAFAAIAFLRTDLIALIVPIALLLAISSISMSLRKVNRSHHVSSLKSAFILASRNNHREFAQEKSFRPLERTSVFFGKERDNFIDASLYSWKRNLQSVSDGYVFLGLAMGVIVYYIMNIEDISDDRFLVILYVVVAIRFAVMTAQQVGIFFSRLMEARVDLDKLKSLKNKLKQLH